MIQKILTALLRPKPLDIPAEPASVFADYLAASEFAESAAQRLESLRRPMGKAMKALRRHNKLSTRAVAKRMGICAPYYCDLENGHRRITPAVLKRMRKAFDL
jgi:DNA-binding transcriptional regulator YiaG